MKIEIKRKFSKSRLIKIITIAVLLTSFASGYLLFTTYEPITSTYVFESNWSFCSRKYPLNQAKADECYADRNEQARKDKDKAEIFLLFLTIGLPIIFFGGRGVYKYIFPKQNE